MLTTTPRVFCAIIFAIGCLVYVVKHVRRSHDPLDYAAWNVKFEPRLSTLYFEGMRKFDSLSYDDLTHAIREFSRLYQTTFLQENYPDERIRQVVKDMTIQRRLMHRNAHVLRVFIPNDLRLEKRLILGIEHTDGGMASALADVVSRFPVAKLYYEAGVRSTGVRAVDDVWN